MDDDEFDDVAALDLLRRRLAVGPPRDAALILPPPPRPMYYLSVDVPDAGSIILVVGQSADRIWRAMIALLAWYEIPEMWEGPYTMDIAIPLVNSYAHEYGYHAIDIESSQLWDPAWGELMKDEILE